MRKLIIIFFIDTCVELGLFVGVNVLMYLSVIGSESFLGFDDSSCFVLGDD